VDVKCPLPIEGLCTRRVLTMEFIEGWKVTDVDKLPPGTDVAGLAKQILEAWSLLVFQEGLVHGDPHPGNIFVESCKDGGVRPVLLDWGITKELTPEERLHVARWMIATLSSDRHMFLSATCALGFKVSDNLDMETLDGFMIGTIFVLRDSLPASAQAYLYEMFDQMGEEEKAREAKKKEEEQAKQAQSDKRKKTSGGLCSTRKGKKKDEPKRMIESIPGVFLFLQRSISLLQGLCSSLNVTIPFAEPILRHAMARVAIESAAGSLRAVTPSRSLADKAGGPSSGTTQSSPLQDAVRVQLEALRNARRLVGAQVAVLRDDGAWSCNLAFGSMGFINEPVSERTLMPLLDAGTSALVLCLFKALANPTPSGARVGLETPVWQVWPEFAQHGKKGVTLRHLMQHAARLSRPFQRQKMCVKRFCNERRMEEMLAAAPQDDRGDDFPSDALASAVAAVLRRLTGHASVADALQSILKPLGLQDDIVFAAEQEDRMAWVVRQPVEGLPLPRIFAHLEQEHSKRQAAETNEELPWLSWQDLEDTFPACADPLLPNRPDLRCGESLSSARGLRGSAEALCRLFAASIPQAELLRRAVSTRRRLKVESLSEWEHCSRCLDAGIGWQLFRFRYLHGSHKAGEEVVGYGHSDASTGSFALRLPDASVVVLLNRVSALDEDPQHIGFDILSSIAEQLGLQPVWHSEVPDVPAKPVRRKKTSAGNEMQELQAAMTRMEERLQKLTEEMQGMLNGGQGGLSMSKDAQLCSRPGSELCGLWRSAEIDGLETLLRIFQVPETFHFLAKQAKRTLSIDVRGSQVVISTATTMASRTVDETALAFKVGEPFAGEQKLGGAFHGQASWLKCEEAEEVHTLMVEKTFSLDGNDVVLEERYALVAGGRLQVVTVCKGLDTATDLKVAGGQLHATMWFDRQGGAPSSGDVARAVKPAPSALHAQHGAAPLSELDNRRVGPSPKARIGCFSEPLSALSTVFCSPACFQFSSERATEERV